MRQVQAANPDSPSRGEKEYVAIMIEKKKLMIKSVSMRPILSASPPQKIRPTALKIEATEPMVERKSSLVKLCCAYVLKVPARYMPPIVVKMKHEATCHARGELTSSEGPMSGSVLGMVITIPAPVPPAIAVGPDEEEEDDGKEEEEEELRDISKPPDIEILLISTMSGPSGKL